MATVDDKVEKIFGIGSWIEADIPIGKVAIRVSNQGYKGLGWGTFGKHLDHDVDPGELAKVRDLITGDYGMVITELAGNFGGTTLVYGDTAPYLESFRAYSDMAKILGTDIVRVDGRNHPDIFLEHNVREIDSIKQAGRTWKEACKYASDNGQSVTWEFEPGMALNTPEHIAAVFNEVDSENFGLLYDTCHGETVGIMGRRQFTDKDGGRELRVSEKTLFTNQVHFIEYLTREKGVRINHRHLIDSNGQLHNNYTSAHPPWGVGYLSDQMGAISHALRTNSQLKHPEYVVADLCFWPDALTHSSRALDFMKRHEEKLYASHGEIIYQPIHPNQ